jgi:hypothetical protein
MARFVFNARPDTVFIAFGGERLRVPSGKHDYDSLLSLWNNDFKQQRRKQTADEFIASREATVDKIVKHGAGGQNVCLAVGADKLEEL